ncbi:MAG: sugar transferase [Chloroflexota bacterium]|nr:sugar transferase [Chloroflexota bacterium]
MISDFVPADRYKRPFDLCVLVVVHLVLFPILLILWIFIPLAIWLEDRGPIFYTQLRVGRGGKVFRLYKFRSMIPDAEKLTGPVWASENDDRVTKVGSFLRNRALDELPQVINMWKGDLSLVGPRPERPELLEQFVKEIPQFNLRMNLRPGLTGLAQLKGRYATKPKDKLRYDVIYMKNMSPLLDLVLLVMSVLITLKAGWQSGRDGKR